MLHTDSSKIFASNLWLYRTRNGWMPSNKDDANGKQGWPGEDYLGVWDFDEFFVPIGKTGGKGEGLGEVIRRLDPPFLPPLRANEHPHTACFLELSSVTLFYTPPELKGM